MNRKQKRPFIDPGSAEDRKKALEELKKKNFHLDDSENEKISGGFIEKGRRLPQDNEELRPED